MSTTSSKRAVLTLVAANVVTSILHYVDILGAAECGTDCR
jgi:hypothetical protein